MNEQTQSVLDKYQGKYTPYTHLNDQYVSLTASESAEVLYDLLKSLKEEAGYDYLCDIAGVDYLTYPDAEDRYGVIYALVNTESGARLFVKAHANDPAPTLPSVYELWNGSNWMEREVYDMFGVTFQRHPDLRRILMPDEFVDYPLRKDYPLRGLGERHSMPSLTRAES